MSVIDPEGLFAGEAYSRHDAAGIRQSRAVKAHDTVGYVADNHTRLQCILPGPEPTGPELPPIQAIHRHVDGLISLHRKDAAGNFENLFAIRSEHLQACSPSSWTNWRSIRTSR